MLIEYVGMTFATVLINTSSPAFEIYFSFHPRTLFVILSQRPLKELTFDLPQPLAAQNIFHKPP